MYFSTSTVYSTALLLAHLASASVIGAAVAKPIAAARAEPEADAQAAASSSASAVVPSGTPVATNNLAVLISGLKNSPTASQRYKLLQESDYGYDFNNPPEGATTMGKGGKTVKADAGTFPALIGNGVSMTVGFIGPCGFNTPHVHPRSAEFNIVVQGALTAQFTAENGAGVISHNATAFQAIIFPQGAMHTEFNPTCNESIFVAGFGNEDPGVQQTAQSFFSLEPDVVQAATGSEFFSGDSIDAFKQALPPNVALGVETCLQQCGIAKK